MGRCRVGVPNLPENDMTLRPLAIALLSLATVPAAFAAEKAASLTEPQVRELLT